MSLVLDQVLITHNPATGAEVGRVRTTAPEVVGEIVDRARAAQAQWSATPWNARKRILAAWWKSLDRKADVWADLIRDEIGKPRIEALAGDVISTLDADSLDREARWPGPQESEDGRRMAAMVAHAGGAARVAPAGRGRDDRYLELSPVSQRAANRPGLGRGQRRRLETVGTGSPDGTECSSRASRKPDSRRAW